MALGNREKALKNKIQKYKKQKLKIIAVDKIPLRKEEDKSVQSSIENLDKESLCSAYLVCPADKRFLVLYTFIKKNRKKKVMVFLSSCMAVKFYHELLNYLDIPVMCIHGKEKETKRTSTFFQFSNVDSGILLCTDVAAKGLDIPAVDWVVQYDPPDDPKEYIHRVGRTARAGGRGHALLFLTEEEIGFIRYLKAQKVSVDPMDITWSKVANIQSQLEQLTSKKYSIHMSAKEAFKSYIRAYISHSLKDIFDFSKVDLKKVAKCFGFTTPPFVDITPVCLENQKKRAADYEPKNTKPKKARTFKLISRD